MHSVKAYNIALLALNIVFGVILIVTIASLINERSKDIVRVTVWNDELPEAVPVLQGITGKVAYAYPVNSDGTRWRLVIDDRSESTS